jgi:hypothetical protein
VFIVNVNAAGTPGRGLSVVADPEGRIVYESGEGIEFVPLNLDLDVVAAVREHGSVALGSRPLAQYVTDGTGVRWPMYAGDPRGSAGDGSAGDGSAGGGAARAPSTAPSRARKG